MIDTLFQKKTGSVRYANEFKRGEERTEGRRMEGTFFPIDLAFQLDLPIIPHLICYQNKPHLKQVTWCICAHVFSSATSCKITSTDWLCSVLACTYCCCIHLFLDLSVFDASNTAYISYLKRKVWFLPSFLIVSCVMFCAGFFFFIMVIGLFRVFRFWRPLVMGLTLTNSNRGCECRDLMYCI